MEKMKRKQEKLDRKVDHQLEESSRSMMSISPSKRTMQYSGYDYGSFDDDHNNDSMMSGGSSMSSISTLFDAEAPVDIYTCINPQSQLYLRCANELTTRRQRQTVITPYVQAQYFTSLATLKSKRTELRVVVDRALNGLKNDEAVLVVKWTAAPVVRFSISDIINIVPEHGSSSNMSRTFSNSESDVMNGMVISPEQEERAQNSYPVRTNDKSSRTSCWAIKQILAVPAASINRGNANLDDEEMVPSPNGKVNDIFILVLKFTGGSFIDEKSKVSNIGHQHAAQNAFNYLDGNVTWSNPVMALTMKEEHDAIVTGKKVSKERKITLKNGAGSPDLKISETEDMVRKAFFAFGVLLGNTITNGVFFAVPVAPILFYIFKLVHETRDMRMQSLAFFQAYEGNLLSATHLQRRADEILAMTDDRYYNFLKSKNLVKREALPFRPIESAAEEANTCMKNASQSGTHSPNSHSGYKDNSTPRFLDAYRDAIRDRNQKGLWFDGPPTVPVYARGSSTAHKTSSLPPIDKRGSVASSVLNAEETAALAQLPSRQEYVTLYLVNEILWGAVDRGGVGTINLQMWASLVRGFKNSLLCDSPLISLCSARIIREVLCVPN
ncbi:hypothetical protein ADEAN_000713000 [Angomonas deanei]|uniref:Uncharacterized protein n=1 Tax=Angomonas deanei TaxID=59799 RepID=A0A7G2CL18_9TRYP|nr:hypothetical protein ADEAN_000713000 [Angomonas deanei]